MNNHSDHHEQQILDCYFFLYTFQVNVCLLINFHHLTTKHVNAKLVMLVVRSLVITIVTQLTKWKRSDKVKLKSGA